MSIFRRVTQAQPPRGPINAKPLELHVSTAETSAYVEDEWIVLDQALHGGGWIRTYLSTEGAHEIIGKLMEVLHDLQEGDAS